MLKAIGENLLSTTRMKKPPALPPRVSTLE
jgi:hypothetical protein